MCSCSKRDTHLSFTVRASIRGRCQKVGGVVTFTVLNGWKLGVLDAVLFVMVRHSCCSPSKTSDSRWDSLPFQQFSVPAPRQEAVCYWRTGTIDIVDGPDDPVIDLILNVL